MRLSGRAVADVSAEEHARARRPAARGAVVRTTTTLINEREP
ncbi:hypothetical protein [Streptomyces sp. NPDC051577]